MILSSIEKTCISRVRIVGNGEPTLHPQFDYFIYKLARSGSIKYLSVLTNGNLRDNKIPQALFDAPVNLIELSVDAGGKEYYESSRPGGSFNRLIKNLSYLKELKYNYKSSTLIKIRLMLRPSQKSREKSLAAEWHHYADTIQPNYVYKVKHLNYNKDLYIPYQQKQEEYPKCTMPFKSLDINWDGNVPLCSLSFLQVGPHDFILGNVNDRSIDALWNGDIIRKYRRGHRWRRFELIPICKGCKGQ